MVSRWMFFYLLAVEGVLHKFQFVPTVSFSSTTLLSMRNHFIQLWTPSRPSDDLDRQSIINYRLSVKPLTFGTSVQNQVSVNPD